MLLRCDSPPDQDVFDKAIAGEWSSRQLATEPDLDLKPVEWEAHFHNILEYIKPIDIYGPYQRGYRAAKAHCRVEFFHGEVCEFFYALTAETASEQFKRDKRSKELIPVPVTRRRFLYGGCCHGSAKHPLGLKIALRRTKEHQEAIRTKVQLAREAEEAQKQQAEKQLPAQ